MIYGVGTDLTDHQRIAAVWQRHGERFARRLLSAVEFAEFLSHPQPVAFLAKRWAAKEAIGKATGLGVRAPFFVAGHVDSTRSPWQACCGVCPCSGAVVG